MSKFSGNSALAGAAGGGVEATVTYYDSPGPNTYTAANTGNYAVFVVSGGAGAGGDNGGGGPGGYVSYGEVPLTAGTPYPLTVGAGGAGVPAGIPIGNPGGASTFNPGPAQVTAAATQGAYPQSGGSPQPFGGTGGGAVTISAGDGGTNGADGGFSLNYGPTPGPRLYGAGQGAPYGTAISSINTYLPAPEAVSAGAGGDGGPDTPPVGPGPYQIPSTYWASGGGGGGIVAPGAPNNPVSGTRGDNAGAFGGTGFGGGGGGGPGNSGPRGGGSGTGGLIIVVGPI